MKARVHVRALAGRDGPAGKPEWLQVIHQANEIMPGTFEAPTFVGKWWAGGTVEEYPDARVIHRGDGSVSLVAKTDAGDSALAQAANALGINFYPKGRTG